MVPPLDIDDGGGTGATGRGAALRSPQFRLLLAIGMAMQLGQWIQRVALLWVVYEITGSALGLGALGFLSSIFVLLLSPVAGVLADRLGARRVLLIAALGQGGAAGALAIAVFAGQASLPLLYVVAATFGIGQALNNPTRNLLVYHTVGRDLLRNGLALNSLTGNTMRVIGPTIGGIIVGMRGAGPAFALQAVLLIAAVFLVLALRVDTRRGDGQGSVWSELRGGVRHIVERPVLRRSVFVLLLAATFVYPYIGFMPIFVTANIGGGAMEQGFLLSAVGLGAMFGLWYVAGVRGGGQRLMLWSGAIYMSLVTAFTFSTAFWLAFALLTSAGVALGFFITLNQTLVQLNADEAHRARVLGVYSMVNGLEPFSDLAFGALIPRIGITATFGGSMGFAALVTVGLALLVTLEVRRRAGASLEG